MTDPSITWIAGERVDLRRLAAGVRRRSSRPAARRLNAACNGRSPSARDCATRLAGPFRSPFPTSRPRRIVIASVARIYRALRRVKHYGRGTPITPADHPSQRHLDILVPWEARGGDRYASQAIRRTGVDCYVPLGSAPGDYVARLVAVRRNQPTRSARDSAARRVDAARGPNLPVVCRVEPLPLLGEQLRWPQGRESSRCSRRIRTSVRDRVLNGTMRAARLPHESGSRRIVSQMRLADEGQVGSMGYEQLVAGWLNGRAFADAAPLSHWLLPATQDYGCGAAAGSIRRYACVLALSRACRPASMQRSAARASCGWCRRGRSRRARWEFVASRASCDRARLISTGGPHPGRVAPRTGLVQLAGRGSKKQGSPHPALVRARGDATRGHVGSRAGSCPTIRRTPARSRSSAASTRRARLAGVSLRRCRNLDENAAAPPPDDSNGAVAGARGWSMPARFGLNDNLHRDSPEALRRGLLDYELLRLLEDRGM